MSQGDFQTSLDPETSRDWYVCCWNVYHIIFVIANLMVIGGILGCFLNFILIQSFTWNAFASILHLTAGILAIFAVERFQVKLFTVAAIMVVVGYSFNVLLAAVEFFDGNGEAFELRIRVMMGTAPVLSVCDGLFFAFSFKCRKYLIAKRNFIFLAPPHHYLQVADQREMNIRMINNWD